MPRRNGTTVGWPVYHNCSLEAAVYLSLHWVPSRDKLHMSSTGCTCDVLSRSNSVSPCRVSRHNRRSLPPPPAPPRPWPTGHQGEDDPCAPQHEHCRGRGRAGRRRRRALRFVERVLGRQQQQLRRGADPGHLLPQVREQGIRPGDVCSRVTKLLTRRRLKCTFSLDGDSAFGAALFSSGPPGLRKLKCEALKPIV